MVDFSKRTTVSRTGRTSRAGSGAAAAAEPARLRGRVARLFFTSPTFSAGKFEVQASDERAEYEIGFAGPIAVQEGDRLELVGVYEWHEKYGKQVKVSTFTYDQEMDPEALAEYLAGNSRIRGVGPVKARRIAQHFKADFDRAIVEEPEKVAEVGGLDGDALDCLRTEWLGSREKNVTMTWLAGYGLTHNQISKIIDRFGNSAKTILERNPYELIGRVHGMGFARVDEIAQRMGIKKTNPNRIRAGLVHLVEEALGQGHTWVDHQDLLDLGAKQLHMDRLDTRALLDGFVDELVAAGELATYSASCRLLVALPRIIQMERDLWARFSERVGPNPHFEKQAPGALDAAVAGFGLNEKQSEAFRAAALSNVALMSGGAGSGKTFTLSAYVRFAIECGLTVALAAPTGKAAKRMSQMVQEKVAGVEVPEATTIHRLLEYSRNGFERNANNPIEVDVLIVDEVSMVDVSLGWHLFNAIDPKKTAVLLVGDHNQLPPVGPGNILRDVIDRRVLPMVVLDQVMRQAGVLKENSLAVLQGDVRPSSAAEEEIVWERDEHGNPLRSTRARPWQVLSAAKFNTPETLRDYLVHLVREVFVEKLQLDPLEEVQILTPTKKGPLGTVELNTVLQQVIQKELWKRDVPKLPKGYNPRPLLYDKVIQTRNNYDLDVMNGTVGAVTAVGSAEVTTTADGIELKPGHLEVRFEDRSVVYDNEAKGELELAYALTIHKYQGSEVPCAVVVVHKSHDFQHHRNLFYTGVTRARKMAIIAGDPWGIANCAKKQEVDRRKTFMSVLADRRSEAPV